MAHICVKVIVQTHTQSRVTALLEPQNTRRLCILVH